MDGAAEVNDDHPGAESLNYTSLYQLRKEFGIPGLCRSLRPAGGRVAVYLESIINLSEYHDV